MVKLLGVFAVTVLLAMTACKTMPVVSTGNSTRGILLDVVNLKAKSDSRWFEKTTSGRRKITQQYRGEVVAGLAYYLENDFYFFHDKMLSSYLLQIADKLLQNWQGPKPPLKVVIESSEFFNAYVDELNILHVSTGLLRNMENEDQLASVLAHEISHFLLRHNLERSFSLVTTSAFELAGIAAIAAGNYQSEKKGNKKFTQTGETASLGFQSAGLVWSDMLSPKRSRKNERDADKLGMDLLIRANYNYEEFPIVIGKIHNAAVSRSERVEVFSQLSDSLIKDNQQKVYKDGGDKWNKKLGDKTVSLVKSLKQSTFKKLDASGKSHEDREQRIDHLKKYLNTEYDGGDLPPEPSEAQFSSVLKNSAFQRKISQDLIAIETINALNNRKLSEAWERAAGLSLRAGHSSTSVQLAKSSVDMSLRHYDDAISALQPVILSKLAPAEAYIKLANLYLNKKQFHQAGRILELGVKRIGRDYRFLPTLIELNVKTDGLAEAETYAIKCKKYDTDGQSIARKLLGTVTTADSYYKKCIRKLGYDVIAKRKRESKKTRQSSSSKLFDTKKVEDALKGLFK